jgi:hypothetical protein
MSRRLATFAFGVVLAACGGWVLAQQVPPLEFPPLASERGGQPKHDAKASDANELGRFLKSRGFTGIALDRLRSGHLTVAVVAAGTKLRLVLDTGAPVTCLDPERTKAMNLKWGKLSGVGPAERDPNWDTFQQCDLDSLDFGAFKTGRVRACVHRVAIINQWLELRGDPPVDGVLGGDVLTAHAAKIDYPTLRLYLRSEP